jgi:hypothetical protein
MTMRKGDGWQTPNEKASEPSIDLTVRFANLVILEIKPKASSNLNRSGR